MWYYPSCCHGRCHSVFIWCAFGGMAVSEPGLFEHVLINHHNHMTEQYYTVTQGDMTTQTHDTVRNEPVMKSSLRLGVWTLITVHTVHFSLKLHFMLDICTFQVELESSGCKGFDGSRPSGVNGDNDPWCKYAPELTTSDLQWFSPLAVLYSIILTQMLIFSPISIWKVSVPICKKWANIDLSAIYKTGWKVRLSRWVLFS